MSEPSTKEILFDGHDYTFSKEALGLFGKLLEEAARGKISLKPEHAAMVPFLRGIVDAALRSSAGKISTRDAEIVFRVANEKKA